MPKDDGFHDDPSVMDLFGDDSDEPVPVHVPDPMTPPLIFTTLEEAVAFVQANVGDGVQCPCCNQLVKRYKRRVSPQMARWLIWLVHTYEQSGTWVSYKDSPDWTRFGNGVVGGDYGKLQLFGLIEPQPSNPDPSKRTSGYWRPTALGIEFAKNRATVPAYHYVVVGEIVKTATKQVRITEALGKKWDYRDVMDLL